TAGLHPEEGVSEHIGLDHLPHVSTFIGDWVADRFGDCPDRQGYRDKVRVTPRAPASRTATPACACSSLGTMLESAATTSLSALRTGTAMPVASWWAWPARMAGPGFGRSAVVGSSWSWVVRGVAV